MVHALKFHTLFLLSLIESFLPRINEGDDFVSSETVFEFECYLGQQATKLLYSLSENWGKMKILYIREVKIKLRKVK